MIIWSETAAECEQDSVIFVVFVYNLIKNVSLELS